MSWEIRAILILVGIIAICDLARQLPIHIALRSLAVLVAIFLLVSSSWKETLNEFQKDPGILQVFGFKPKIIATKTPIPMVPTPAPVSIPLSSPLSEHELSRRRQIVTSLIQICKSEDTAEHKQQTPIECINKRLIAMRENFYIQEKPRPKVYGNIFSNITATNGHAVISFEGVDIIGNEFKNIRSKNVETPIEIK